MKNGSETLPFFSSSSCRGTGSAGPLAAPLEGPAKPVGVVYFTPISSSRRVVLSTVLICHSM